MSSSEGYILNAVQTPGPLYPVYLSIAQGNTTKKAIKEDTGVGSNLDATLSGLQLLRLIGREEGEYYTDPYRWETGSDERDFKLTALYNLAQEMPGGDRERDLDDDNPEEGDWGKQAVVLLNYHYLIDNNIQYFENNDTAIYDGIDKSFKRLKYKPTSSQGRITHNDLKFGNWTRLVHFLGLAHKVSGREHTVYPDPDLVRTSVKLAIEDDGSCVDGNPSIETEQYLRWLQQNLLYVKQTSDGNVPKGLAAVLFKLVREGALEFVEYGDAGAVGLDGVPPHDGIDSQANTIQLTNNEF